MGINVRQFIESLSSSSIVSANELTSIRALPDAATEEADAEALVRKLVAQGKLTKFQALNLYQGRAKGLLFGEYVVLDKLGAGGMGQVYKAQHRRMKRIVALKVLPPHAVGSPKAVQRFYQEVEVAAKVTHPNIVTAYDAGEARGLHFLVMEYVEGKDLSSLLSEQGPLGVEQALNVILQAARGLAYAHGLGIVHRDIKPANLLINRDGVVKVLDMGLARIDNPLADPNSGQDELTATGEVMGTVDYMSPEQAQDTRATDHRTDIYALGCTLYRLLTGKVPFPGETTIKKILAHRDQPIPSVRAVRPEVPEMVDRLLAKMLAKKVDDRMPTMAAVVAAIEKLSAGVDDERSSIAVGSVSATDEPELFNFMQAGSGASGVLPGLSAVGKGPGSSQSSGSKGSGSLGSGSMGTLPPSVGGAEAPAAASRVAAGTVFPSSPAAGKVAKAKRLTPGDTDSGGRTEADGAQHTAGSSLPAGRKRAVLIGIVGGAIAAAVLAAILLSLLKSEPEPESGPLVPADVLAKAAAPQVAVSSAASVPVPPLVAPPLPPPPSVGGAPAVVAPPPLPDLNNPSPGSAMSFFGGKEPPAEPTATAMPTATPAGGEPSASKPPQPSAPKQAVAPSGPLTATKDLLALVEPEKTQHHGNWKREGDAVVCEVASGPAPRVLVPFVPPEEYDLECTAVLADDSVQIGVGFVVAGRQVMLVAKTQQSGLGDIDGTRSYEEGNPTRIYEPICKPGEPAALQIGVRRGRTFASVNGKTIVDFIAGPERFTPLEPAWAMPPGQMFLHGNTNARFTKLTIGPPAMRLPPPPSAVNVAAAFDKAKNLVEGEASASRGEIIINYLPGKPAKLSFPMRRLPEYSLRLVVERTAGDEYVSVGIPVGSRRIGVTMDWSGEKVAGLNSLTGGGANQNPSGRRPGMLLVPGSLHVVVIDVRSDPKGHRIRLAVDGREIFDYAGQDFNESAETQVPDRSAVSLACYSTGLRIVRFDVVPLGAARQAAPTGAELSQATAAVQGQTAQAGKSAAADAKLSVVDSLRRQAADDMAEPALRYAALEQALRLAAEAGDFVGAVEAADDWATTFDVDRGAVLGRVLETFAVPRPKADAKAQFAQDVLAFLDVAARSEEWDTALALAGALDKSLGTTAADVKRELRARLTEYALAKKLNERRGPPEKRAAGADGLYRAVALGDWAGGMKLCAAGDDAALKSLAALEAGELKTGDQRYQLAEKWWELSEAEKDPPLKWAYMERAAQWYRAAAPLLSGKARTPLERRKTALAQQRKASGGAGGPRRPLDAVKIGDRWYKYYPSNLTWQMAGRTCEQLGGRLPAVDSPVRNQALSEFLLKASASERATCWLGLSDLATEGTFVTTEGLPQPYSNWQGGEPDNAGGVEDGAVLDATFSSGQVTGLWRDWNIDNPLPFLCEWDR